MYVCPLVIMVNIITNSVFYEKSIMSFWFSDLGLQKNRLDGDEYLAVIDEFMEAVFTRWPHVIVQVH